MNKLLIRSIKVLAFFLLLTSCDIAGPIATHCDSSLFGRGVDSVDTIDCQTLYFDTELAVRIVTTYAKTLDSNGQYTIPINETTYRSRMSRVHLRIKGVKEWNVRGESCIGNTNFDQIAVNRWGLAIAHESLHAYDLVGLFDNLGSILAIVGENNREAHHWGWEANGYYEADRQFSQSYVPLQSLNN